MYKFAKKVANHEGFTLVELIVVIAILGILAGIAIPVYSGYINKANQAKDNVLLGAVNSAFVSAVLENNPDATMPTRISITMVSGKITSMSGLVLSETFTADDLFESFKKYYGTNIETPFVFYDNLGYDKAEGFFGKVGTKEYRNGSKGVTVNSTHDDEAGTTTYTVTRPDGSTVEYTVSDADRANVLASTFGTNMTADGLVNNVGSVVDAAAGVVNNPNLVGSIVNNIMGSGYLEGLGVDSDDPNYANEVATALTVAVANQVTGMTSAPGAMETMLSKLTSQDTINQMAGMTQSQLVEMVTGTPDGIAKLALMYGMMTGYANSDTGSTVMVGEQSLKDYFSSASAEFASATGGSNALQKLLTMTQTMANSSGFSTYVANEAQTDFQGLVSALNAISGNGDVLLTEGGALQNGFTNNSEIATILAQFFG